jgi:GAF domain-containing protein
MACHFSPPPVISPSLSSPPVNIDYSAVFVGQERALQLLQNGAPVEQVLTTLVQTLESALEKSVIGSILILDEQRRLRHGAAPSLPAIYNRAIDGIEAGPYGTCCAAAHRNEVVVTTDIEHDAGWAKLKDYPLAIRLKAAWSCPIRASDGRVLGTFGTYFRECRGPTATEREIVTMLARTAAIAIERAAKN